MTRDEIRKLAEITANLLYPVVFEAGRKAGGREVAAVVNGLLMSEQIPLSAEDFDDYDRADLAKNLLSFVMGWQVKLRELGIE